MLGKKLVEGANNLVSLKCRKKIKSKLFFTHGAIFHQLCQQESNNVFLQKYLTVPVSSFTTSHVNVQVDASLLSLSTYTIPIVTDELLQSCYYGMTNLVEFIPGGKMKGRIWKSTTKINKNVCYYFGCNYAFLKRMT
jgi:hypothetical protein